MVYKIVFTCLSIFLAQEGFSAEFPIYQPYGRARENGVCDALADVERHLKTLDKKVEEKSQQPFVFWNHYLSSMQCALEGKASEYQEQTVDQLYDMWGAIPGHHTRHHRDFRNVLTQKARDIDRVEMLQKNDQQELSRLRQALQAEQAAKHELAQVVLTLTARIAALEGQAQQLSGQFQESKNQTAAKISALEREKSVLQGQVGDISGQLSVSQQENLKKQVAIQQQIDALHAKQQELEAQKRETQAVINQRDQANLESAQLRAERDQVRAQLAQAQQQNAAQLSALEHQKMILQSELGNTSGQLTAAQQEKLQQQALLQQKIDELNQKQREVDVQNNNLLKTKKEVSHVRGREKERFRALARMDRRLQKERVLNRTRSSSPSRLNGYVVTRMDIYSTDGIKGLQLYGYNGGQDPSAYGTLVGNQGAGLVGSILLDEAHKIDYIGIGATGPAGIVSGFLLHFSNGETHQFGAYLEPREIIHFTPNERLTGVFGVYDDYINRLGFITTEGEYGPYGECDEGKTFMRSATGSNIE